MNNTDQGKEYFNREVMPKAWAKLPPAINVVFDDLQKRVDTLEDRVRVLEDGIEKFNWVKTYC